MNIDEVRPRVMKTDGPWRGKLTIVEEVDLERIDTALAGLYGQIRELRTEREKLKIRAYQRARRAEAKNRKDDAQ